MSKCLSLCFVVRKYFNNVPASVAQLDAHPAGDLRRMRVRSPPGWQHSFVEIDHEIFFMVILSLLLIQEEQLPVSRQRMYTMLVNCSED